MNVAQGAMPIRRGERDSAIRAIKVLLFSASVVPSVVAGAVAFRLGGFDLPVFLVLLGAVFLAQAGGDYLYYYFSHLKGDGADSHTKIFAGWRPFLVGNLLRGKEIAAAGAACLIIDIGLGIAFTMSHGWLVAAFGLAGGMIAIFFTPLMLRGLKEPVIFLAFGPLTVLGIALVLTGGFPAEAWAACLPVAFLVTVVAHLKSAHFTLVEGDEGTVVVRLRRRMLTGLTAGAYLSLVGGVVLGALPVATLVGLLTLPMAVGVLRVATRERNQLNVYLWAVVRSIAVLIATGLLLAVGLALTPVGG